VIDIVLGQYKSHYTVTYRTISITLYSHLQDNINHFLLWRHNMKHEFSLMMSNLEMLYAGFEEVYFLLKFQFSSFSIDFILQDKQNMHTLSEYKIYLYSAQKRLEIICKLHIYICSIQITVYSETMYVYSICIIKQSVINVFTFSWSEVLH
jgi:hypothetical protein